MTKFDKIFTKPCIFRKNRVKHTGNIPISGKSTVVNMIPRLYDVNGGSVSIAGVDVRDFDLKYLRECVGVVTQETYLFNGTILENLRYAKADATRTENKVKDRTDAISAMNNFPLNH